MLTGDAKRVADQVAGELGLDAVYSELLPQDKVAKVEEFLREEDKHKKLAFVGDGINDAPVLSRAMSHCHGSHGVGCRHRSGGYRFDGR